MKSWLFQPKAEGSKESVLKKTNKDAAYEIPSGGYQEFYILGHSLCSVVKVNKHLGGAYCLHFQCKRASQRDLYPTSQNIHTKGGTNTDTTKGK